MKGAAVMPEIERREHERIQVLLCQGAVGECESDMNSVTIKDISLGGIGFTSDSNRPYEKQKVYELKLKADMPWDEPELKVKIVIIRTFKNAGRNAYGAVYRNLSDKQLTMLKKIVSYQQGLDSAMKRKAG